MTIHSLHRAVRRLAHCRTVADVSGAAIDGLRMVFDCRVGVSVFLDDALQPIELSVFGVRDADVDEYQRDWQSTDLVSSVSLQRAAPVHNWEVYRDDALPPVYTQFGRRLDMYHYLSAPLFGSRGTIGGFLSLGRGVRQPSFTASDLGLAGAFAGFLSATLARVKAEESCGLDSAEVSPQIAPARSFLTRAESEVLRLLADGLSNREIAKRLFVSVETVRTHVRRVLSKLGVRSRTQAVLMVSRGAI